MEEEEEEEKEEKEEEEEEEEEVEDDDNIQLRENVLNGFFSQFAHVRASAMLSLLIYEIIKFRARALQRHVLIQSCVKFGKVVQTLKRGTQAESWFR
jgi:hypothetical protein